jgi:hypothetical protein
MRLPLVVVFLLIGPACFAAPPASPPRIVCDTPVYDFGDRSNTGSVKHAFLICNSGGSPLQIGKIKACCGSTTKIDTMLIPPGSNTTLNVELRVRGRRGKQRKSFYIASNDPATPNLRVALKGTVIADIGIDPAYLNFGNVSHSTPVTNSVKLTLVSRPDTAITGIVSSCKEFIAKAEGVGDTRQVRVQTVPPLSPGVTRGQIRLQTDDPKRPEISFGVSAAVVSDLQVVPREILLTLPDGDPQPVTRYVALRSRTKTPFKILSVDLPDTRAQFDITPMGSSGWRCKLTNLIPSQKLSTTNIIIHTNHPDSPSIPLPIKLVTPPEQP